MPTLFGASGHLAVPDRVQIGRPRTGLRGKLAFGKNWHCRAIAVAVNKNGRARTPRPGDRVAINTLVVEDSKDIQATLLDLFSTLGDINVVATASTENEATELSFITGWRR
jgi:hypothetical protein